jgi:hypothetical protein
MVRMRVEYCYTLTLRRTSAVEIGYVEGDPADASATHSKQWDYWSVRGIGRKARFNNGKTHNILNTER